MIHRATLSCLLLATLFTGGCSMFRDGDGWRLPRPSIPGVFKANIQQGNVVTQDMVDQLEPGMTRRQVAFIMGEPILGDSFRPDRWHYVYTLQVGSGARRQHQVTLLFEGDELVGFEGDFVPSDVREALDAAKAAAAAQASNSAPATDNSGA